MALTDNRGKQCLEFLRPFRQQTPLSTGEAATGSRQEGRLCSHYTVRAARAGLPVGVLCAHVHLEEDPLGESLKALPALPEVPVTELRMELAGGSRARQDALVLHVDSVKSRLDGPRLVQEREVPAARSLWENHGALRGGRGEFAALAEGLQGVLPAHGFHDRGRDVY